MTVDRARTTLTLPILLAFAACGGNLSGGDRDKAAPTAATSEALVTSSNLRSDRGGIGIHLSAGSSSAIRQTGFDPRRSLAVTDAAILAPFTLRAVLDQIVATAGAPGLDAPTLFHQWWDSENVGPGMYAGPHCNDQTTNGLPSLNGVSWDCPRAESSEATSDPFGSGPSGYLPIGIFNRFDLADENGADCGEYRIVFARRSGQSDSFNRNLFALEARLPNPDPASGIKGCYPVAKFWYDLSFAPSVTARSASLQSFFFSGLPGFEPVIHADHYGAGSTGGGQIRTNQYMDQSWVLREFKTVHSCTTGGHCTLQFAPSFVKVNPSGALFGGTDANAAAFQSELIAQVGSLTIPDINRFDYAPSARFDNAQSKFLDPNSDYRTQFVKGAVPSFRTGIQGSLTALGRSFTPEQVINRVEALSCTGCHGKSAGVDIGGGLKFPSAAGVVHVSEIDAETTVDGTRYQISSALTDVFLPFRQQVLFDYLNSYAPKPRPTPCLALAMNCCGQSVCIEDANICPIACLPPADE